MDQTDRACPTRADHQSSCVSINIVFPQPVTEGIVYRMTVEVGSRRSGAGLGWIWLLGMTAVALQVLLVFVDLAIDDFHAL